MAIWQYRVILIPEKVLLGKYDILPLQIPMELAEDFPWWSDFQPPAGFEQQIDLILPQMESWSTSLRMWGKKDGDDAYVCYVDESRGAVEEISFRLDARAIAPDLVSHICALARKLGCVLMTAEYEIFAPDESMVLRAVNLSISKRFVDDPVSALQNLDKTKLQERIAHLRKKDEPKSPPEKE